jgi:arylsulfatase
MRRSTSSALLLAPACATALAAVPAGADARSPERGARPNIILIMVDDMGYSDVGCFGGEIPTPNIDRLAQSGIRYTRFYNTGRSCPTRASLLTGLYPHQAGIGAMSEDPFDRTKRERSVENRDLPGYNGYLNRNCVTIAEVMKEAGYHTYMVGKWHLGMHGMEKWPLQRGFDRYYGILSGASSYLRPQGGRGLTLDNSELPPPRDPYYTTDAFTDHALGFLKSREDDAPFFLYVAYNAPHWPLQAKDADIEKFIGKYDAGWEAVRQARHERMKELGIVDKAWPLAEWESRAWSDLTEEERRHSALRMSVYAAQVHCMDYNVGRIVDYLEETGQRDNTLIVFFSDNGACAEPHSETGFGTIDDINKDTSWVEPSYGLPWAQVSNTPLRKYKVRAYEGGISTCFVMSWPGRYGSYNGEIRHNVAFLPDIMATFVDAGRAVYPKTYHGGNAIHPLEGKSMLPSVEDRNYVAHEYIFGEHFENRYVRWREWKAVKDQSSDRWELFDMAGDRTETHDLAADEPAILKQLTARWQQWADSHNVYPKWE